MQVELAWEAKKRLSPRISAGWAQNLQSSH